jgi:Tol biopolymer transport system component
MWRKIWIVFLVFGALRGVCREGGEALLGRLPGRQEWKPYREKGLPWLPRASLLAGVCPFFLKVTHEHETLRVLPELGEPGQSGDQSPIYPSISRDGKMVAYAGLRRGGPRRRVAISTYSVIDGKRTVYAEGDYAGAVAISPDASKLAFSAAKKEEHGEGDNHLHIIDLKTGQETLGPEVPTYAWVIASWSPDSRHLAYDFRGEVRVWDADTGKVTKIADGGGAPSWSPSGEWIAYYRGVVDPEASRILKRPIYVRGDWAARLLVVHPDGSGGKTLFAIPDFADKRRTPRGFIEAPVWSPDSQTILINEPTGSMEGTVDIQKLDLKTLKLKTIFKDTTDVLGWGEGR